MGIIKSCYRIGDRYFINYTRSRSCLSGKRKRLSKFYSPVFFSKSMLKFIELKIHSLPPCTLLNLIMITLVMIVSVWFLLCTQFRTSVYSSSLEYTFMGGKIALDQVRN